MPPEIKLKTKKEFIDWAESNYDMEVSRYIAAAHTAGRKEALEGVLEVVEGMDLDFEEAVGRGMRSYEWGGYNQALKDIKNHLES